MLKMKNGKERAEWLINRALNDGDNRKMRRALNSSVKISRAKGDYEHAAIGMQELTRLTRNMRKFRKWKEREHPGAKVSIEIKQS